MSSTTSFAPGCSAAVGKRSGAACRSAEQEAEPRQVTQQQQTGDGTSGCTCGSGHAPTEELAGVCKGAANYHADYGNSDDGDSDEDEGDEREMFFGERRPPTVMRTGGGSHGVGGGCAPRYVDAAVMQRMAELTQETVQLRGEVARLREEQKLQR
ncbi:hypothetical protein CGC21_37125 [Leishmania donovani]|uniref:Uncharacterized protein n=1 Tax=Leishmania donovani TaxID=5661 RepID=A0A504Y5I5_LEIDO|nr:hypothetical protein CGC21_37105 [Leishmania donovani]TPP53574.1 hypothetical protein CGC21_37125 [Leishmania donovani]